MTNTALAGVVFRDPSRRPGPGSVYRAPVRLPTDDTKHSFGQWTLVVEFVSERLARVRFLMPEAPHSELLKGRILELFEGTQSVATVRILVSAIEHDHALGVDQDALWSRNTAPRAAA